MVCGCVWRERARRDKKKAVDCGSPWEETPTHSYIKITLSPRLLRLCVARRVSGGGRVGAQQNLAPCEWEKKVNDRSKRFWSVCFPVLFQPLSFNLPRLVAPSTAATASPTSANPISAYSARAPSLDAATDVYSDAAPHSPRASAAAPRSRARPTPRRRAAGATATLRTAAPAGSD